MRPARFTAMSPTSRRGCRRSPSRVRFWSRRGCSVKSPGCSSRRSAVVIRSRACPSRNAVPAGAGERRRTPLGGAPAHAADRSRGGNRDVDAALGAGAAGRRPIGADRRRAWDRQVAADRRIPCPAARHSAHLGRMELLAASAKHAAAPGRRMGPPAFRRRRCIR